MKLRDKYPCSAVGKDKQYTVAEAVDVTTRATYCGGGELELLRAQLNETRKFVAELTQKLHDDGTLDDVDLHELLPTFEKAV